MFLALYFFFLLLAVTSYLRTIWTVKTSPGYVPLHPTSRGARVLQNRHARRRRSPPPHSAGATAPTTTRRRLGTRCRIIARIALVSSRFIRGTCLCVRVMGGRSGVTIAGSGSRIGRATRGRLIGACGRWTSFCPSVGGMVAENCTFPPFSPPRRLNSYTLYAPSYTNTESALTVPPAFKFFAQFTFYAWLFCTIAVSAAAYSLAKQVKAGRVVDGHLVAILFLAGLLGIFSAAMSGTAVRFVLGNMTNVDLLKKRMSHQLAVRVPLDTPSTQAFS